MICSAKTPTEERGDSSAVSPTRGGRKSTVLCISGDWPREVVNMKARSKQWRWGTAALALGLLVGAGPAMAIVVGINAEVHQDVENPELWPNDFHIEGRICSNGAPPVLIHHIDGPFPNFNITIMPDPASPDPCWYLVIADWWLDPGDPPIPYCTVINLALIFDVEDENIYVDLAGWWTLDGERVGQRGGELFNNGFVPVMGFNVEDFIPGPPAPEGQYMTLVNGNIIEQPGPQPIPVEVLRMELVPVGPGQLEALLGDDPYGELRIDGMQQVLPWVPVVDADGEPISRNNPEFIPPDSFFDVFYEIPQEGKATVADPFAVEPGGYLLMRQLVSFVNNGGGREVEERWFFEIHGANDFPEACCLPDGACVTLPLDQCIEMGGFQPPGGICLSDADGNGVDDACEQEEKACCLPDGSCTYLLPFDCGAMGGFVPAGGVCLGDADGNGVDDACEQQDEQACCLPDGSCTYVLPADCPAMGGFVPPGGVCLGDANSNGVDDACEQDEQACCLPDGSCAYLPPPDCALMGGFLAPGGACLGDADSNGIDDACESDEQACCLPDGSCVYLPPAACNALGGFPPAGGMCLGDADSNGVDDACESDDEACCLPDGTCVYVPAADCAAQGGFPPPGGMCLGDADGNGVDDACESDDEACCLPDGSCVYVPAADCAALGGFPAPGGVCLGDADGNGVDDACEDEPAQYLFEFSLDIGSDTEMSDPFADGDEAFDPGDVYWWQSAPVLPPGRDGFKDDQFIFGQDPWPDPPDPIGNTPVPVGWGSVEEYWSYFDLDGHDQLDVSIVEMQLIPSTHPLEQPIPQFDSNCIYRPEFLAISFDDDMGPGWPANDVPVTAPSIAGVSSYGTSGGQDEVLGLIVGLPPGMPPYPLNAIYPVADEVTVHQSLAPNPDGGEEEDDDVDSLDVVPDEQGCPFWYFSADHEAHLGLDPGSIYEVIGGVPMLVIDDVMHLGIPEETDLDAFEFTWIQSPDDPTIPYFAVLFSVDDDDPLTPGDESGGLNPAEIYGSLLTGFSFPFTEPLPDDVDAITIWRHQFPVPVKIASALSCRDHAGVRHCLFLGLGDASGTHGDNVEPRLGGAKDFDFHLTAPVVNVTATASCANNPYTGTATASAAGNLVNVTLTSPLVDQDCCWVDLAGDVNERFYVAGLEGDVNRDGIVNTLDSSAIKARFGNATTAGNFRWDVNTDGIINTIDYSGVKARFGNTIPTCP